MARTTTFKGSPLNLAGTELKVGDKLPAFKLTGNDMSDVDNRKFAGCTLIITTVPSLDTPVCSIETKRFNHEVEALGGAVKVLTVSMDLPFAQSRWCGAEGVKTVTTASDYKYRGFGESTGTYIQEWGLLSRAVIVADASGTIRYVEYVPEIAQEPDYAKALAAAK